jgi:LAS superfamily LD-carboxypeptidase LdcB
MVRPSEIARFLVGLALVAVIAAVVLLRVTSHAPAPGRAPAPSPPPAAETCDAPQWRAAAAANAGSLTRLAWTPFGRAEVGWATYAPLVAREVGTGCAPNSPGFAGAYARWQVGRKLQPADGVLKPAEFDLMRDALALRRPFVLATARGLCPAPPPQARLSYAAPEESYGGKPILLRTGALAAYRRMVASARAAGLGRGEHVLQLVSGFRSPAAEAARCADGGCNTLTRAHCSAHRTGMALDLYLAHLAGQDPTASDDANRAAMARSPEYRWLVANAARFGFLNYAYEPWHWEWTGEPL